MSADRVVPKNNGRPRAAYSRPGRILNYNPAPIKVLYFMRENGGDAFQVIYPSYTSPKTRREYLVPATAPPATLVPRTIIRSTTFKNSLTMLLSLLGPMTYVIYQNWGTWRQIRISVVDFTSFVKERHRLLYNLGRTRNCSSLSVAYYGQGFLVLVFTMSIDTLQMKPTLAVMGSYSSSERLKRVELNSI